MTSAELLFADDHCGRRAILAHSWERHALSPSDILRRSVQHGLGCGEEDAGLAAGDVCMSLCVDHPIDTEETDLLGLATHMAALADMVVWMVQGGAWKPSAKTPVGAHMWVGSAFEGSAGLRQVLLVDVWNEERKEAALNLWAIGGEMAVYDLPMTLVVAVIGKRRDGRWRNPFTLGHEHPINRDLRFRKRDGTTFGSTWNRVWREDFKGTREDWLNSLTDDGLLPEMLLVEHLDVPARAAKIRQLAADKLERIAKAAALPPPQLSVCHDPIAPCPYKTECPNWRLPSERGGFVRVQAASAAIG